MSLELTRLSDDKAVYLLAVLMALAVMKPPFPSVVGFVFVVRFFTLRADIRIYIGAGLRRETIILVVRRQFNC